MARVRRIALAALVVVASGCANRYLVTVEVERGSVSGDIYSLRETHVFAGGSPVTNVLPEELTGQPLVGLDFGLIARNRDEGELVIDVDALDDNDVVVGSGTASIELGADTRGGVTVLLTLGAPSDTDMDGVVDALDNCPMDANPNQEDCDSDDVGDLCDSDCACCMVIQDMDMDGIQDADDNCPNDFNPLQEDTVPAGGDGVGDACGDFDMDGSADGDDCAPEDMTVFPGALDNPDGTDQDCAPGRSSYDLTDPADAIGPPVSGNYVPRHEATSSDIAVVTLPNPTSTAPGLVVFIDLADGTLVAMPTSLSSPGDVAVNDGPAGAAVPVVYVTDADNDEIVDFLLDGTERAGTNPTFFGAGPGVAFTPNGNGFAGQTTAGTLNFFSADEFETGGWPPMTTGAANLSNGTAGVTLADVAGRIVGTEPLSAVAFFLSGMFDVAQVAFLPTTGSPVMGDGGVLLPAPSVPTTDILYDQANDLLLVSATDGVSSGEILVWTANASASMTLSSHVASDAGTFGDFCPTGMHLVGSTLYIADACNDRILTANLAPNGSNLDFSVGVETPTCGGPITVSPAASGSMMVVGCPDRIEVHGAD